MNQVAKIEERIDRQTAGTLAISNDDGGMKFGTMLEVMEFAKMMAVADIAVPPHLRGNAGACLAVAIQAVEWRFSPFAVANKSYSVNNRMAYEAQLIHAVILSRAPIKGRPKHEYSGEGETRQLKVWVETTDGEVLEYESPPMGRISPKNSPLWKNDPDQQLHYFSVRSWCRRHFPDVILGVYAKDELEDAPKDVTPQGTGLAARLKESTGGFDAETIDATLGEAVEASAQASAPETAPEEQAPVAKSEPLTVDWNDARQAEKAIDAGILPEGFSLRADGALIIPDDLAGKKGPKGHTILASSFKEIVTVSGKVVKTAEKKPDLVEAKRQGERAALAGDEREPGDMLPAERAAWLESYDAVIASAEKSS